MSHPNGNPSWYQAVLQAAAEHGIALPRVKSNAMGTALWQTPEGDRAVSIKCRLLKAGSRPPDAVIWGFWLGEQEVCPVLMCPQPLEAEPDRVLQFALAVKGWIVDRVSVDELRIIVDGSGSGPTFAPGQPNAQPSQTFSFGDAGNLQQPLE